ncbi:MAG: cysteine hydrolase [Clostridiales bacterium]|jgi:nicotinamidase-related amidase|nr:cysteine hydrolase [Clostridiales bacterium]
MRALLSIDYTNDFIADSGALTCGQAGQAIEAEMVRLAEEFLQAGDYVTLAVDMHDPADTRHPENKLFPAHNLSGTKGRELYGALGDWYKKHKHEENVYWMDKTRYSAFAGTDLYLRLKERGINEIHLCGVCTDICVLHTMVDGYNLGFQLAAHIKATASFNNAGHLWALEHFKNALGAKIISGEAQNHENGVVFDHRF